MAIPQNFIHDLLNRIDIVDVVERYVPLKKAGANYEARCPFHNDKSPSFTVSRSKQFYHCFGCGAHGNAIGFLMEYNGMTFPDAVEDLARSIGVTVPRETSSVAAQRKVAPDLYEVMQTATRYYREQLKQSPRAIEYLKRRGLSGEIAARFGIGYAPEGWQNLEAVFPNYQDASLVETGLVIANDEGKRYDRFRDRIMFPIVNARGQIIGFGGRILDQGEPKYLNSPETQLFEKGRELYGLFQAQKAIRAEKKALVVEGYMDVVALAQLGVEYAVATLGTATTPFHIQKLLKLTEQVVFCFDGDTAGRRAAWRALENALPHLQDGKQLRFLFLPPEHDPDSYIRAHGKDAFERLLEIESLPLSAYLLGELSAQVDLQTQEGRSALLEHAKPLVTAITAPATGLLLRKELAARAGVSQDELEGLYKIQSLGAHSRRAPPRAPRSGVSNARALLRCLLFKPELAKTLPDGWQAEESDAATALVAYFQGGDEIPRAAVIIQQFHGTAHAAELAAAQADILQWGEDFDVEAELLGLLEKQQEAARKQQLQALQAKGLDGMNAQEQALYRQLLSAVKRLDVLKIKV
ncbi:MAG: DNA primase [Gallionellaceae bacterium]|nr:DNA primase [Gallionellaceae bacterium]